ncbi:MAG: phenylalanine--tRNA ligase subunit beta, partial [Thermodesulfobacteriaceae bacterium]|nr:phenylalanine--tRNA ligase subunit beta [Thermodesulfobacteriaceae bacterium]
VTEGKEVYTVLTTAKDQVKPNLVLAFAKPGSLTFTHQKIEPKEIKKYKSEGMFLSPYEAGISEEKNTLLTFEEGTPLGKSIYEILKISEPCLEVAITPNRGDLLSIYGLARELNLICDWEIKPFPNLEALKEGEAFNGKIIIEDTHGCFRYIGRSFSGIEVKESPFFIQKRLFLAGLRPINNIVDITNYVLLELGQPLHAFDFKKIEGKEIHVRQAREGESLLTLDGINRILAKEDLVIADQNKALVLAGIMGGEDSGVTYETEEIFLEAAWFNPKRIRMTAQRHKITTESSYRFERKIDPEGVLLGLLIATDLILKIVKPKHNSTIYDYYPHPYYPPIIEISSQKIYKLLGFEIETSFLEKTLKKLGTVEKTFEAYKVKPHSYRQDLKIPEDLIEEIARLYGYDKIPTKMPWGELTAKPLKPDLKLLRKLSKLCLGLGLTEVITYSFIDPEVLIKLNLPKFDHRMNYLELENPIAKHMSVMRTTLIPGLLECAKHNSFREVEDIGIFEIGKVFYPSKELAEEKLALALLLKGRKKLTPWEGYKKEYDIFDLKGILEELFSSLKVSVELRPYSTEVFLKRGISFDIFINGKKIGYAGALKSLILEEFDLKGPLFIAEIDVSSLLSSYIVAYEKFEIKKPPKYPSTSRDVSCVIDKKISLSEILDYIRSQKIPYLEKVELIALYEGASIPEDKKSITLRFYYRGDVKTLVDEEVNLIQDEVAKKLFDHFKAKPR